jgi:hypothetical protein
MRGFLEAAAATLACGALVGCGVPATAPPPEPPKELSPMEQQVARYRSVRLEASLGALDDAQRRMIGLFIDAAHWMDEAFWIQALPDTVKDTFLASIEDPATRRYAEINYGPWDRLAGNEPFIQQFGPKPPGANFYPPDMTKEEFEAACAASEDGGAALKSPYTMVRRRADRTLEAIAYHSIFAKQVDLAAAELRKAAALAADPALRRYLELRAEALRSSDYRASDLAWLDVENNDVDIVIGPIENYEDQLFNHKTAFEAFVLIRDRDWSQRLARYAALLPELQRSLPVPDAYKREQPGTDSDLGAYDVVYYAGDANAGAKTIAINLPNDEQVQLEKGTRRLQLKNAMRAKFDAILLPIARLLIVPEQRDSVSFDAFFANTMFHEVAHGLGIKNTVDGRRRVREALLDAASVMEEGKADVLGLYMVTRLHDAGQLDTSSLEEHYVTFLAGIFRSVRFGASSAHGRANMIRFNFFAEAGAFSRDPAGAGYRVDLARMREAVDELSRRILVLQGDGDYAATSAFIETHAVVGAELAADLERVNGAGIPVDIVFEQGKSVLGL